MRFYLGPILLVCAACILAQTPALSQNDDPEVARAKANLENLRALVEAGALPRIQLEKAAAAIADAQDAAFLRKTLYGPDLTPDQADEMIAVATRRFDRRKKAFDDAKNLVDAGVEPPVSLATFLDDLSLARKTCDLAETRAKLTRELAEMAKAEEAIEAKLLTDPAAAPAIAERFDGDGVFTATTFTRVETAFSGQFGKPLPVSAMGDTAVHRALGFDHTRTGGCGPQSRPAGRRVAARIPHPEQDSLLRIPPGGSRQGHGRAYPPGAHEHAVQARRIIGFHD